MKKIPAFEPPTPEQIERRKVMYEYRRNCHYTRWTSGLQASSMPTRVLSLTIDETQSVIDAAWNGAHNTVWECVYLKLKEFIEAAKKEDLCFIKGESRSAKDMWESAHAPEYSEYAFGGILHDLMTSMRVFDDMAEAVLQGDGYSFLARKFIPMDVNREFRVFSKNNQLLCCSWYNHKNEKETFTASDRRQLIGAFTRDIEILVKEPCAHAMPHPDDGHKYAVADFYWHNDGSIQLIEVNPYGFSDPCLAGSYDNIEAIGQLPYYKRFLLPHTESAQK